jgi:hypothetical protein
VATTGQAGGERRWSCFTLCLLACLALIAATPNARADEPFGTQDSGWEGCSTFVTVAGSAVGPNLVVTQQLAWGDLRAEDGLVVLHPTHPLNPDELSSFLRAGGRVAVLDDYGAGDQILARFHIQRIPAPQRPVRALRNNPALAIAEPVADATQGRSLSVHPIVANLTQVVTNHPTALSHPNLSPVLQLKARGEPDAIIAVAGQVGRGRLLAVSDPSIVINQMMRYPGNREFAMGLARYLIDDDTWGSRGGKLYIVTTDFREQGAFGNQSSFAKTVGTTLRDLGGVLSEVRLHGLPGPLSLVLGALAALGAVLWLSSVGARAYRRLPPRFARPVPLVAQGGIAGRAAVLAAPTTHRALAILELKSALEESMAARLGLDIPVSAPALLDGASRSGALDDSQLKAFKRLLFMMGTVETSVTAGRPIRIRESDLNSAANTVKDLLQAIERNGYGVPHTDDRS